MDKEKVWIQTAHLSFLSAPSVWTHVEMIFMCLHLKALYYYGQAAVGGHTQAQYRYAKLLLTSRGHQSLEELNTAISLLEQSAAAGLIKVENCHDIFLNFTYYSWVWLWKQNFMYIHLSITKRQKMCTDEKLELKNAWQGTVKSNYQKYLPFIFCKSTNWLIEKLNAVSVLWQTIIWLLCYCECEPTLCFPPSSGSGLPGLSLLSGAGQRREQVCPVPEDGGKEWSEYPSRCF